MKLLFYNISSSFQKKNVFLQSSQASSFFPSDQQAYESWINDPTGEENYAEVYVSFNFIMTSKNTLPSL